MNGFIMSNGAEGNPSSCGVNGCGRLQPHGHANLGPTGVKTDKFKPSICACCFQTKNYDMSLDRGTAMIVLALANAVSRIGRNSVHMRDEMEMDVENFPTYEIMIQGGFLTSKMIGNVSRARYHGLIAFVERSSGVYLLTPKGADFIHGKDVYKTAIIDKVHGKNAGYYEPDGYVNINQLLRKETEMWSGNLQRLREEFGEMNQNLTFNI